MPSMRLIPGDCRESMDLLTLCGEQFDSIVTDPPYELSFMGREWDNTGIAFRPETWRKAYDALKPGGYLVAFGGSRTYHRIAVAIEDAGFEIRDSLMWLYGTGFPKSHDISKAIDKAAGAVREKVAPRSVIAHQRNVGNHRPYMDDPNHMTDSDTPATPEAAKWQGWGSALKPAFEPILLARKPLDGTLAANTLRHGVGGLNIDACRIAHGADVDMNAMQRQQSNRQTWKGGQASGLAADHVQSMYSAAGRWPANVLHDGSDEVMAAFAAFGERKSGSRKAGNYGVGGSEVVYGDRGDAAMPALEGSSGSAARFFYCAKASAADRAGSKHPTVKPLSLMRWLCTLVTPPGGHILDPFAGSGTTLQAAHECGFDVTGCEREAEYQDDIRRRIANAESAAFTAQPQREVSHV